jgi:hypothetical protein
MKSFSMMVLAMLIMVNVVMAGERVSCKPGTACSENYAMIIAQNPALKGRSIVPLEEAMRTMVFTSTAATKSSAFDAISEVMKAKDDFMKTQDVEIIFSHQDHVSEGADGAIATSTIVYLLKTEQSAEFK